MEVNLLTTIEILNIQKETIYTTFYKFDKLPPHTNRHKILLERLVCLLEKYFKVEIKSNFYDLIPNHFLQLFLLFAQK